MYIVLRCGLKISEKIIIKINENERSERSQSSCRKSGVLPPACVGRIEGRQEVPMQLIVNNTISVVITGYSIVSSALFFSVICWLSAKKSQAFL